VSIKIFRTAQQDLHKGVNANVQLKSSIPIGAKLEISRPPSPPLKAL
jgi:hypothetical protein